MTSGAAGSRRRRAHAGWVTTYLRHLRNLRFRFCARMPEAEPLWPKGLLYPRPSHLSPSKLQFLGDGGEPESSAL